MHASTKWLIGMIVATVLLPFPVALGYTYPMILPYNWHKTLHIVGAVVFLENIIVTGAWMLFAEWTRNPSVLRFAARVTNWADVVFTGPGVLLLLANGLVLTTRWGGVYGANWIIAALGLFVLSGVVWVGFLIPYQHRMIRLSEQPVAPGGGLHRWYVLGMVATVLPLVSLALMVHKPRLW